MKMIYLKIAFFGVSTFGLTSCDGCDRKSSSTQTTEMTDGSEATENGDGTTDGSSTGNSSGNDGSRAPGFKNKAGTAEREGVSAPDGTADENHDGDPYTKHDTTPMPTGTSIK